MCAYPQHVSHANLHSVYGTTHTVSTHTVHTLPPYSVNSHSAYTTTIQCQLTQCIQHEEYCHTVARYQEILDCRVVSEDVLPNVEWVVPVVSQQIGVFIPGQCKPCCALVATSPGLLIPSAWQLLRYKLASLPPLPCFLFFGLPIRVAKKQEGLGALFCFCLLY